MNGYFVDLNSRPTKAPIKKLYYYLQCLFILQRKEMNYNENHFDTEVKDNYGTSF